MKKKLILFLAATALFTVFYGCTNSSKNSSANSQITTKKKYVIATDATYAPFEFQKEGKYVGIDLDILDAIAKLEDFQYELNPMDFKGIIPALQSNQIDGAIAGINITEDRKKVLDFSDGYYESGLATVIKKGNAQIKSLEELKGKTLAVKKGTAGAKYAEDNKEKNNFTIKYFNDTPSMFQEVRNGNADATFEDYPVIAYNITTDPSYGLEISGDKLTKANYGFAVKKNTNKELITKFNDGLKKLKENGEYDKIIARYIKK